MAYPYDDYGDLTDAAYDDIWNHLDGFVDEYGNWDDAIDALFDWSHETYPDIDDGDVWDVFRDYYKEAG